MLINLSNHELAQWSNLQAGEAEALFGKICDLPFPTVSPSVGVAEIAALAATYVRKCQELIANSPTEVWAIHVMGEMTFVYQFVKQALARGLRCVASTTERVAVEKPDGSRTSGFRFVAFRDYEVDAT